MSQPTLVILAAGMGSRYGGLKQMDPVDKNGNLIIDYSVYDAARAGFTKVVCIIKKAIEKDFDEVFGSRISKHVAFSYAFQEMELLPAGITVPDGRKKPWGTGHALLCAAELVDGPFAVINADDFYGLDAFQSLYAYLSAPHTAGEYAMVSYLLEHTLTDHGEVTRGVCSETAEGYLATITETHGIRRGNTGGVYKKDGRDVALPAGTPVSMNFWGFDTSLFKTLESGFPGFLEKGIRENPLKCEYLLPSVIADMLQEKQASVKMLRSHDEWFGVTYQEDKPTVYNAIEALKKKGVYPEILWK